ncbi:hypothetical protein COB64_01475 [Candidatus Wolfebacteria bacterium]|nr:MAG: hypothetical protein COB64_01475 [Candidatus Wolfebacteria bacterium]
MKIDLMGDPVIVDEKVHELIYEITGNEESNSSYHRLAEELSDLVGSGDFNPAPFTSQASQANHMETGEVYDHTIVTYESIVRKWIDMTGKGDIREISTVPEREVVSQEFFGDEGFSITVDPGFGSSEELCYQ